MKSEVVTQKLREMRIYFEQKAKIQTKNKKNKKLTTDLRKTSAFVGQCSGRKRGHEVLRNGSTIGGCSDRSLTIGAVGVFAT